MRFSNRPRSDAQRFCRWLSQRSGRTVRLPTFAEWRHAANGDDDRRLYPWGPGFDYALATTYVPKKEHPPIIGSAVSDIGPYGHRDLAGSVREWLSDAGIAHDAQVAGGSWSDDNTNIFRTDYVEGVEPAVSSPAIGFRILVEP